MSLKEIARNKCYGGYVIKYEHQSKELDCKMKFNVFLPKESTEKKVPAIYFLAGLTCSEDNFIQKAGAMREAAKHGLALIAADTSPRDVDIQGVSDSWDLGSGAGFYVDATEKKWAGHFRMYSYIVKELFAIVQEQLPIDSTRVSLMGHSMGGHGALTIFLKNQSQYKTASAFAPIAHPTQCHWGQNALGSYLGTDKESWKAYDTVELLKSVQKQPMNILVDVGTNDSFLKSELYIDELEKTTQELGYGKEWTIRYQDGYDHSYFFISTFIADHIEHHAKILKA
ncbi:S-formylglutathione hydrolase [Pilobolus umbonatus]|nr:S-formylglutathione hydrolase [Pilobolus umbonatus]